MATYNELRDLFNDSVLRNRVEVALCIAAQALLSGTPTAADRAWAYMVLASPQAEAEKALKYLLALNKAAAVAAITGATDATIQAAVDGVVAQLVSAHAGA